MNTPEEQLDAIARTAGRWLAPGNALTSYQAMMEIVAILERAPREQDVRQLDHHHPRRRAARALRASSFLG